MKLYLLRHGETVFNKEGRWQGWSDSPLTDKGIDQAKTMGSKIRGISFDRILCSPLGRAVQTCDLVIQSGQIQNTPVYTDELIRERNVGYLAGIPFEQIEKELPHELEKRNTDPLNWCPKDGESSKIFIARVRSFIQKLEALPEGETILCITHGGVCSSLYTALLELPPESSWSLKIPNTSLSVFEFSKKKWSLLKSDITVRNDQKFML